MNKLTKIFKILLLFSILLLVGSAFVWAFTSYTKDNLKSNFLEKTQEICNFSESCLISQSLQKDITWPHLNIGPDINRNIAEDLKVPDYAFENIHFISNNSLENAGYFIESSDQLTDYKSTYTDGVNVCLNIEIIRIIDIKSPAEKLEYQMDSFIEGGAYTWFIKESVCDEKIYNKWMPYIFF